MIDLGGYRWPPTYSNWLKTISGNLLFLVVFWFLNFFGHFESLNDIFSGSITSMIDKGFNWTPKMNLLNNTFPTSYCVPQTEIICQSYTPKKLIHQTTQNESTKLLAFHIPGLGFWIFFMLKMTLEPHCNNHILVNEHIHHISSQR